MVGRLSNQRERAWTAQVDPQLVFAVCDIATKTILIDRPKGIKIVAAVVTDCESHTFILDRPKVLLGKLCGPDTCVSLQVFQKSTLKVLLACTPSRNIRI